MRVFPLVCVGILAIILLCGLAIYAYYAHVRTVLVAQYETVRAGRAKSDTLVVVDREVFDRWESAIMSDDWEIALSHPDAFSVSFPALPGARFSPDINGYLDLRTADLPRSEQLTVSDLRRWHKVAGLQALLGGAASGKLYVYREDSLVRGFRLPSPWNEEMLHLGMLRNGTYAEYVLMKKPEGAPISVPNVAPERSEASH